MPSNRSNRSKVGTPADRDKKSHRRGTTCQPESAMNTANRVAVAIDLTRPYVDSLSRVEREAPTTTTAVDFGQRFIYQQAQARAHASGNLTPEEAMAVYVALGEVGSDANGGWATETDLATKVVVTTLVHRLLT